MLLSSIIHCFFGQKNQYGQARALEFLARVTQELGDSPQSDALAAESIMLYREIGDQDLLAQALERLSNTLREKADYHDALPPMEEGMALWRAVNNRAGIARLHHRFGDIAREQGAYERARRHLNGMSGSQSSDWRG